MFKQVSVLTLHFIKRRVLPEEHKAHADSNCHSLCFTHTDTHTHKKCIHTALTKSYPDFNLNPILTSAVKPSLIKETSIKYEF